MVEVHHPDSLPTSRCSSGVEHFLGKEEVVGSIPINGSKKKNNQVDHRNDRGLAPTEVQFFYLSR
jgi:hypothetical protein